MRAIRISVKTLALTLAIGLFATASPAAAANDVLGVDSASLVARGAAVDVTYSIVCDVGTEVFTSVRLAQRSGKGIATGAGGPAKGSIPCTGETQAITVWVLAASGPAFKTGPAVAAIGLGRCLLPQGPCEFSEFSEVIRITR